VNLEVGPVANSNAGTGEVRLAEVSEKLERVREWLRISDLNAALFTTQPGVAWVTGGLEDRVVRNEEPGLVWVAVDASSAHMITNNVEEPRLVAEANLDIRGFELHVTPWYKPGGLAAAAAELVGETRLATDGHGPGIAVLDQYATLRLPLTSQEMERLAELGADCAEALEQVLMGWRPEERERELAARIAAGLEERGILPSVLLVGGSERRRLFRHPVPTNAVTGKDALAVIVGLRGGLNISCSRSVSAGEPPADLELKHRTACAVEAAMIAATRPGRSWESALEAGQRAYEEGGFPGEWQAHWQGGPVGYLSREFDVVPNTANSASRILAGSGFAWNPTVQGGKSEDTFIVTNNGVRPVSNTATWPQLVFDTPLGAIGRPAILRL